MRARTIVLTAAFVVWNAPALAQTTLPSSSADWIVQGDQPTGSFGAYVASAGDVDGDGYDDAMVGDARYDGAFTDAGRISFYRGSTGGLTTTPAWSLEGGFDGARLSVAFPAGDVNGDGFDDLVVQTGAATLSLYLGSPAGPIPAPSWTATGISTGHGDVNGDGFADLAVFSYPEFSIFYGSSAGLELTPSTVLPLPSAQLPPRFISGPILDDFDGDGRDDLAYTWRYCTGKHCLYLTGQLRVYMGADKGLSTQVKRTIDFGRERWPFVVAAGDVDGDGFAEAAVNDYPDPAGGQGPPVTYLLRGSRSGLPAQAGSAAIEDPAGYLRVFGSGDGAGDINGDGFADYLLPLQNLNLEPNEVSLWFFAGAPQGYSQVPLLIVTPGPQDGGLVPARAGDVNGDGLADLIIGAPGYFDGTQVVGRVYGFLGRSAF